MVYFVWDIPTSDAKAVWAAIRMGPQYTNVPFHLRHPVQNWYVRPLGHARNMKLFRFGVDILSKLVRVTIRRLRVYRTCSILVETSYCKKGGSGPLVTPAIEKCSISLETSFAKAVWAATRTRPKYTNVAFRLRHHLQNWYVRLLGLARNIHM